MKISLSVQTPEVERVLPLALLSGSFEEKCRKAINFGADGLELITTDPTKLNVKEMVDCLGAHKLVPSAISSGGIASVLGLTLLSPDNDIASKAYSKLLELIEFASEVGAPLVTIGSFRGRSFGDNSRSVFIQLLRKAGEYASEKSVRLAIEPLNRYENNFINNTFEGLELMTEINHPSVGLLIDTFHANIEESTRSMPFIEAQSADKLFHVHIADNNRRAPGLGLIAFGEIFQALKRISYDGFVSAELLPLPTPDEAARITMEHSLSLSHF